MTIQKLQKKKHLFKNRSNNLFLNREKYLKVGTSGLQTINNARYELVYLRVLKKKLKQKHIRGKIKFFKAKFWFFIKVNYILSSKATNARMGSGTGNIVRITANLKPRTVFTETRGYTPSWLKKLYNKLRYKYSFYFIVINVTNKNELRENNHKCVGYYLF